MTLALELARLQSLFFDTAPIIVSLCKQREFIFQSSEIYGGTGSWGL